MWQRPVLARVWQNERRTAGAMPASEIAKRIYGASAIGGPNNVTMVSGTIRVAYDTPISSGMMQDWKTLHDSLPGAAFDVVLNMCDYQSADPAKNNPRNVIAKMREIEQKLGSMGPKYKPDAWFFDFYDRPFSNNADCKTTQNPKVMFDTMTKWAHGRSPRQLVGGNIWGESVPPSADFVAVPDEQGIAHTLNKVKSLGAAMRLVHVENNPQKCDGDDPQQPTTEKCQGNGGDKYIWRTSPEDRIAYNKAFAGAQTPTIRYVTPVLFPLSSHLGADGTNAFDAVTNARSSDLPKH